MKELDEHVKHDIRHEVMGDWLLLHAYWPRIHILATDFVTVTLETLKTGVYESVDNQTKSQPTPGRQRRSSAVEEYYSNNPLFQNAYENNSQWFEDQLKSGTLNKYTVETLAALYLACDRGNKRVVDVLTNITSQFPKTPSEKEKVKVDDHLSPDLDRGKTLQKWGKKRVRMTIWNFLGKDYIVTFFHVLNAQYNHQFETKHLTEAALVVLISAAEEATDIANTSAGAKEAQVISLEEPLQKEWDILNKDVGGNIIKNTNKDRGCWRNYSQHNRLQNVALTIEALGGYIRAHQTVKQRMEESKQFQQVDHGHEHLKMVDSYIFRAKNRIIELELDKEASKASLLAITVLATRSVLRLKREKVEEMYEDGFLLAEWKKGLISLIDQRDRELENYKSNMINVPFLNHSADSNGLGDKYEKVVGIRAQALQMEARYYTRKIQDGWNPTASVRRSQQARGSIIPKDKG